MNEKDRTKKSKFLSYVLRHHPAEIGITLDDAGWVGVDELLQAASKQGRGMSRASLEEIVATNNKKRFEFSDDGQRIRARQGHSVDVDLGYEEIEPPQWLFHGTAMRFLDSIRQQGLIKGQRHHVHMSVDQKMMVAVGQRHGKPAVLRIAAQRMRSDGHVFYRTENHVWLTEHVPSQYLEFPVDGAPWDE